MEKTRAPRDNLILKKVRNINIYTLISLVLVAGLFCQIAFSLSTINFTISSSGRIGLRIFAASGSPSDIQTAVNSIAPFGGIVIIPSGTYYWNGEKVIIPGGVSVMGETPAGCKGHEFNWELYNATVILHNNASPSIMQPMFYVDGSNAKNTRIANIQFEATPPADTTEEASSLDKSIAIQFRNNLGQSRVDHCTFIDFCGKSIYSSRYTTGHTGVVRVLVDHCVISLPYKLSGSNWVWGYGCYPDSQITPTNNYWNDSTPQDYFGNWDNLPQGSNAMYIEDCHFSYCRHGTDAIQGAFYCARYNLFDGFENNLYTAGAIDMHGSGGWVSGKGCEAYNNIMISTGTKQVVWMYQLRGGSGLFYNNQIISTIPRIGTYDSYMIALCDDNVIDADYTEITDTYIWNNTYSGVSYLTVYSGGYQENVE